MASILNRVRVGDAELIRADQDFDFTFDAPFVPLRNGDGSWRLLQTSFCTGDCRRSSLCGEPQASKQSRRGERKFRSRSFPKQTAAMICRPPIRESSLRTENSLDTLEVVFLSL